MNTDLLRKLLPNKLIRRLALVFALILCIAVIFFLLRGPYLSNSIKRLILPVLEKATGERVIIDKAAINLFPLYLQAKGFKVFNEEGNKLLRVTKIRAYIDFSGLFFKEIRIRRLTVREPELTMERQELEGVINSIKNYLAEKKEENVNVSLKSAKITDGTFILSDTGTQVSISGTKLRSEIAVKPVRNNFSNGLKNTITVGLSLKDARLKLPDLPEIRGSIEGMIKTDGSKFEVSGVRFYSLGSIVNAKGEINPFAREGAQWGSFSGIANIFAATIRNIFNLKNERDGELSIDGSVSLVSTSQKSEVRSQKDNLSISLNLRTKGWFYLETLMELLKITDNISGIISFDGRIHGTYPDLLGETKVTFKNGMLGTLPMDDIAGTIKYENKKFSLEDFIAHTYEGELKGNAYLSIPYGNYSVFADVVDINSPKFLKFIRWEPPFPRGKISGNFELSKLHNKDFDIKAMVNYINPALLRSAGVNTSLNEPSAKEGAELKDRLKSIKGKIELKEGILTINDSQLSTSQSDLFLNGDIDLKNKKLNLDLELKSKDAVNLTTPHYDSLRAPVEFRGKAEGSSIDPEISGNIDIGPGSINDVPFTSASGNLTYSIKSLSVKLLRVESEAFMLHNNTKDNKNNPLTPPLLKGGEGGLSSGKAIYDISGNIKFKKANKLFSFNNPYYDVVAVIKNGDAKSLIKVVQPQISSRTNGDKSQIPITGFINGQLSFKGDHNDFGGKGEIAFDDGVAFGQMVEHAVIKAVLSPQKIDFSSIEVFNGQSRLNAKGSLYFDDWRRSISRFDASILSDNIELKDITFYQLSATSHQLLDARLSVDIKGSGTFKKPDVKFSLKVLESSFRGAKIGKGIINGELKDKRFSVKCSLLEGIVTADATGIFSKPISWDMNVNLKKGSYDFILSGFLKDVPSRNIGTVSLEGAMKLEGRGDKLSMDSNFSFMNFSLYGYNFKNKGDVIFKLSEKEFMIKSFSFAGKDADMSMSGVVKIGQSYDVAIDGRINLEPLRAISKSIELLRGHGNFIVGISGSWKDPEFRGKINIRDSSVIVSGFPYKIGPINGDIFLDKNRVTFDSFNTDFASGKVTMSGVGYLKGLTIKGLSISSILNGIKLRTVNGVSAAFDGRLFYDSSQKGQSLIGDIYIKKAKYEKRIEWKRGLLALKEVKIKQPSQIRVIPTSLRKTKLNVHIIGLDNISIDNNIARTPVKIDITITGTAEQYGLIGRIKAAGGGSIFFRGNEFKIIDGSVDFVESNRITPVFHIQAETFTKGYRIRLSLDGPIDKFTLSLFSDPPLADTDILTLLTVGQISKEAKGFESGIGAGEVAAFLTGELQEVMEERFKYITGFERFEVDPHTTATGAVSPKVTVGKRLFKEKVFVTYSTSIGTTEEHIIKLEYNLSKNVSLIGSRDEIGSVGGDIKFRFEFK